MATTPQATGKDYHTGRVVGLASTAALGGFLFGYDSAVINGAATALKDIFGLGDFAIGFVVSIALIGSAIGAWFAGSLADRFGRKKVMLVAAGLFLVAAIGQAFPLGVYDLCLWRFIGGAGIGVASVMAPMYIAEIAPPQIRGRMGSLQQFAIVIGIFATGLVNFLVLNAAGGNARNEWLLGLEAWQWMFLSMLIPAVVYALLVLRIPSHRVTSYRSGRPPRQPGCSRPSTPSTSRPSSTTSSSRSRAITSPACPTSGARPSA